MAGMRNWPHTGFIKQISILRTMEIRVATVRKSENRKLG
jgi:hypothetical protein